VHKSTSDAKAYVAPEVHPLRTSSLCAAIWFSDVRARVRLWTVEKTSETSAAPVTFWWSRDV
jgi:hypothetical protein